MSLTLDEHREIGQRQPTPALMSPVRTASGLLLDFAPWWATATQSSRHPGIATAASYGGSRLRVAGVGWGEVKEEGRAQPGPGDMSPGPYTAPAAREVRAHHQRTLRT